SILSLPLFYFAKIYLSPQTLNKTFLNHYDFSNLDPSQASQKFDQLFSLPNMIQIKSGNFATTIKLSSISASVNKQDSLVQLFPNSFQPLSAFFKDKNYQLKIQTDPLLVGNLIATLSAQISKPFIPTEILLAPNHGLTLKPGQLGYKLDEKSASREIINYLVNFNFDQPLFLTVETIGSLPNPTQSQQMMGNATKLLGHSIILNNPDYYIDDIQIDDKNLISWLDFTQPIKETSLSFFIKQTNQSIKKDPVNAVFRFQNQKVIEFKPARPGFFIDQPQLLKDINQAFKQLISSPQAPASITLKIPLRTIEPIVRTQDVNNLGIKELLGRGVSTFHHSSKIRNMNVARGASVVSGILVPPGQKFSFIKSLGEVSISAGYHQAYIIRQGRTELDVGGGICQVSTTLFRAMLDAGLDIIDRRPHAFRVSYYEEDSPPGYDATVFIPKPDLTFINDTAHHILIQSTYNDDKRQLVYEIYGTDDGRKVEISNYKKWGWSPPPPTRYINDPNLPPGKLVREEYPVAGLKTAFDWKVTRNREIIHQKTFSSSYVPWPAVFRRGV
ncbi:hypothetical protein DRH14_03200, partial [Candidatus Shapirobacteria bacterium]